MCQCLNFGTKEHVVAIEIENVVYAGSTAFGNVRFINGDAYILVDAFNDDCVPVAIVDRYFVGTDNSRSTAAVKPVLYHSILNLKNAVVDTPNSMHQTSFLLNGSQC
jgi:hypothetical protein